MRIRSLSTRLFLLSLVWTILSLAAILFFIANSYRDNSERRFNELLTANLYNLMGAATFGPDGVSGTPELGDPRYISINSGWYWQIASTQNSNDVLRSKSLVDQKLKADVELPFDRRFQRIFQTTDVSGNAITAIEGQAFLGEGDEIFSFIVTGNRGDLDKDVNEFIQRAIWMFLVFGVGLVGFSWIVVHIGLAPLKETTRKLANVRNGEAETLLGDFPLEIEPLIDETNALIEANRQVVERARTQVGNLAHGLKTPIAVIQNEVAGGNVPDASLIANQTDQMKGQIQTYLDRARISARRTTVVSRTPVAPVVERMIRVISKLSPNLSVSIDKLEPGLLFAGEQQDLEELLGNLLENASRFAQTSVQLSATAKPGDGRPFLLITISDDGPGMTQAQSKEALKRGQRVDESTPGSGLGLSIVKDIAQEYGGSIELGKSNLGGLEVIVQLPMRAG